MVTKKVRLEFADSRIQAVDHIYDIQRAVEHTAVNLLGRHKIILKPPYITKTDRVIVEIRIPEEIEDGFSIGNHLRGISNYLINHGSYYKKYRVGKRLLNYVDATYEMTEPYHYDFSMSKFEAVVSFTRLLERSDEKSLEKVNRIVNILKEEDDSSE